LGVTMKDVVYTTTTKQPYPKPVCGSSNYLYDYTTCGCEDIDE